MALKRKSGKLNTNWIEKSKVDEGALANLRREGNKRHIEGQVAYAKVLKIFDPKNL